MEDILVPLGFFAMIFGFPLVRREMIHRHTMERLKLQHGTTEPLDTAPQPLADDAAALALRLPEPHRLYALALLCRLQDLDTAALDGRTAYLIHQSRHEYLPQTLRAYLNLTPAASAHLHATGQNPEQNLREQLELINSGLDAALGQDQQTARQVLTQGAFLREVFQHEREKVKVGV